MKQKTYIVRREMPFVEVGRELKADSDGWLNIDDLFFTFSPERAAYLIKHGWIEEKVEWWVPDKNEEYFYLDDEFDPVLTVNSLPHKDNLRIKIGNCFKTSDEAQEVADKIKELIKEHHRGKHEKA